VNSHSPELIPITFILNIEKEPADCPWNSSSNLRPTRDSVGTVFGGRVFTRPRQRVASGSFLSSALMAVSLSPVHVTPAHHLRGLNDRPERLADQ
jgi:hypothetical protein